MQGALSLNERLVRNVKYVTYSLLFLFCSSCSVYYNAKEQSAYIPTVSNQNITLNHKEFSNSTFIGFNHFETQSNFRISKAIALQNNIYFSKGFKMADLGISYRMKIHGIFHLDISPGLSYGDMNYSRKRAYVNGTGGSDKDIGYVKNEYISYRFYGFSCHPSIAILFRNNMKLFIGSKVFMKSFVGFNYNYTNEKSSQNRGIYELLECESLYTTQLNELAIEPTISVHLPYKHIGVFFQTMYYGPIGNSINTNKYNIMSRATIPVLMSVGFTLNPHYPKKKLPL